MPQSRFPMPPPEKPSEHLDKKMQIVDLLTAVMLPGAISAFWPDRSRGVQAIVFLVLFGLALPSIWWGTSIANAHNISSAWQRLFIHLYAFCGFAAFLAIFPASFMFVIGLFWRDVNWLIASAITMICITVMYTMFVVERRRIQAADTQAKLKEAAKANALDSSSPEIIP
jgi:hypothetical protein